MNPLKVKARFAGSLYLMMAITNVASLVYFSNAFIVPGNPTATALTTNQAEFLYRVGIVNALASEILFLFLVVYLYDLFKDIDKRQAVLMVVLVTVGAGFQTFNLVNSSCVACAF